MILELKFRTMRIYTIILILIGFNSLAQTRIDTLFLPKSEKFTNFQSEKMKFPIIKTGSEQIDSLIVFDLKNKFTNYEYPELPINSTIIKWADDNIIYLNFEVTYNQNGILSLNISAEGCGAYCSGWTNYYNYSTVTGKSLEIIDIINTLDDFKKMVNAEKNKQYIQQRKELMNNYNDPKAEIDKETYEWALEYYNSCDQNLEVDSFALFPNYIQIIEDCKLPHVIRSLSPIIKIKYNCNDIQRYLKIKI